jgi:hypothetical protein
MSFGPLVTGDKNGSRSDVLWETTRGEFLVDVKSLRVLESDVGARAYRMLGEAIEALGGSQTELVGRRLDVVCSASGANFPKLLSAAVAEIGELNKAHVGATGEQDFVKATLHERAEDADAGGPCIRACAASVGTTPTKISPLAGSECWLTVSFLFGPKLHRAVRAIVGRARRQLRDSARPAIIYLEAAHLPTVVEYLREVMLQGVFAAIPLVIVSDGQTPHLVRRQVMDPVDESLDATLAVLAIGENAA